MQEGTSNNFEDTPLWLDVQSVFKAVDRRSNTDRTIRIHTKDGDFDVWKIIEIQEKNDYVSDYGGSVIVRFYIGLGDYVYKLYPYRDTLEASVKTVILRDDRSIDEDTEVPTYRYRALLNIDENPSLTGDKLSNQSYQSLNQTDMVQVCMELQDRNFEVLRSSTVEGFPYMSVTPQQLITCSMIDKSNQYVIDGKPAIEVFNFDPPDNQESMPTAVIETGTKVALIPTYVQEKLLGVYKFGLGTHYQRYLNKPTWFVYPLYNPDRFDNDVDRMVIFVVPQDKLPGIDRTWRKEGKVLYILTTGDRQYTDDSQVSDLNKGLGFRMADARAVETKPADVDVRTSKVFADRARFNTEIGVKSRTDGIFYAPTVSSSANPYKMYSRIAARQVSQVNIVWENSNAELVYPGMPCKYVFMDHGEYVELKGTILGKYTVTAVIGAPTTSTLYKTSTSLGMCLEYHEKTPEQPDAISPGTF